MTSLQAETLTGLTARTVGPDGWMRCQLGYVVARSFHVPPSRHLRFPAKAKGFEVSNAPHFHLVGWGETWAQAVAVVRFKERQKIKSLENK